MKIVETGLFSEKKRLLWGVVNKTFDIFEKEIRRGYCENQNSGRLDKG
mgnify:CR=1 FL=1